MILQYEINENVENDFDEIESNYCLKGNAYIDTNRADVHYYRHNYQKAYDITKQYVIYIP
jgi:hypothetical protein